MLWIEINGNLINLATVQSIAIALGPKGRTRVYFPQGEPTTPFVDFDSEEEARAIIDYIFGLVGANLITV